MLEEALREKLKKACEKRGRRPDAALSRQIDALVEVLAEVLGEVVEANHSPFTGEVYFRTKIER